MPSLGTSVSRQSLSKAGLTRSRRLRYLSRCTCPVSVSFPGSTEVCLPSLFPCRLGRRDTEIPTSRPAPLTELCSLTCPQVQSVNGGGSPLPPSHSGRPRARSLAPNDGVAAAVAPTPPTGPGAREKGRERGSALSLLRARSVGRLRLERGEREEVRQTETKPP